MACKVSAAGWALTGVVALWLSLSFSHWTLLLASKILVPAVISWGPENTQVSATCWPGSGPDSAFHLPFPSACFPCILSIQSCLRVDENRHQSSALFPLVCFIYFSSLEQQLPAHLKLKQQLFILLNTEREPSRIYVDRRNINLPDRLSSSCGKRSRHSHSCLLNFLEKTQSHRDWILGVRAMPKDNRWI